MRGIKHVLTERQYAWEDAVKLAETDPEVNLSGEGPAFTPSQYLEEVDEVVGETEAVEAEEAVRQSSEEPPRTEAATEAPATSTSETKSQNEAAKL